MDLAELVSCERHLGAHRHPYRYRNAEGGTLIERLSCLQNDTEKKAVLLQLTKCRLREGLCLVEGVRAVLEVRSSSWIVTAYLPTDLPADFLQEASGSDVPYYELTGDLLHD
jgi:hypothetical protein